ncbi:predicted protein [Uncinocarpus reesii 1704]|uniref:GRF-type domain-containing protein n=1 Tax=Uncinocarpus reesii (strain UAMH 1704) TaxID=336963 RepID=C4JHX2_UNCRE|nr:uncharacterized protein UREG_01397 [Uncinocarpus reesii 1704]EEP76548.1 predicted protein [Uncinocarpus reesii 1704]
MSGRGLFLNGEWLCDCIPRQPAVHLQTSNGGPNDGRWFYKCPKSQRNRCRFFLWEDEASRRVGRTATGNPKPEPRNAQNQNPRTPTISRVREIAPTGLPTPETGQRKRTRDGDDVAAQREESPSKSRRVELRKASSFLTNWEVMVMIPMINPFGWGDEMDGEAVELIASREKTEHIARPSTPEAQLDNRPELGGSKEHTVPRNHYPQPSLPMPQPSAMQPPPISLPPNQANPPPTPTPVRFTPTPLFNRHISRSPRHESQCQLVSQTLALLEAHRVFISEGTKRELINLLEVFDLRTEGIIKGRDISRMAIKTRDAKIQELLGRIECLEAERETWRAGAAKEGANAGSNLDGA